MRWTLPKPYSSSTILSSRVEILRSARLNLANRASAAVIGAAAVVAVIAVAIAGRSGLGRAYKPALSVFTGKWKEGTERSVQSIPVTLDNLPRSATQRPIIAVP